MHFIGMLAIQTTSIVDYLVLPTLISFLVCVLVTGVAIFMASLRSKRMILGGALFMGIGIAAMHYVGMAAWNSSAMMENNPAFVTASIALAISASGLALWLAFIATGRFPAIFGAVVFGGAVSGMHYIAMAGMSVHFMSNPAPGTTFISSDILAMVVSIVAFVISGIFMLALIPKEPSSGDPDLQWAALDTSSTDDAASPHAGVRFEHKDLPVPPKDQDPATMFVPFEQNGGQFQIAAADIVSIHANAHYTYVFNGRDDFFCPLSISEVEAMIGTKGPFFRTHRSHIVNLRHIERIQKSGDAASAELNSKVRRSVPVARGRVSQLRREWAERVDAGPILPRESQQI